MKITWGFAGYTAGKGALSNIKMTISDDNGNSLATIPWT
jgi:hypothetical protein